MATGVEGLVVAGAVREDEAGEFSWGLVRDVPPDRSGGVDRPGLDGLSGWDGRVGFDGCWMGAGAVGVSPMRDPREPGRPLSAGGVVRLEGGVIPRPPSGPGGAVGGPCASRFG
ncbi:MAG: hypothetical protein WCR20_19635, partial [Verrucomicrobiota bacterium]